MILRVTAGLAVLLGVVGLLGYLEIMGEGPFASPAARHLRAAKDRIQRPAAFTPFDFDSFEVLPHGLPLEAYAPLERRGVSLEGYVQRMLRAMDGDIHLEVARIPRPPGERDTAYVTAEITQPWQRGSSRWRYEPLLAAFRPNHGGATAWDSGPRRVRISGWPLYDFQYDVVPSSWSLRYGSTRVTGWEIHPVTRIELWDEARGAFVDYAR